MTMKIFVCVPMTGRTTAEIEKDIEIAKSMIGFKHVIFFGTAPLDKEGDEVTALGDAIKTLGGCDAAVFAPGWEASLGCKLIHEVCEAYKVQIYS